MSENVLRTFAAEIFQKIFKKHSASAAQNLLDVFVKEECNSVDEAVTGA